MSKKPVLENLDKRAAKKAAVLGSGKSHKTQLLAVIVLSVMAAGGGVLYATFREKAPLATVTESTSAALPQVSSANMVAYAAADFEDGQARFFQHRDGNLTIKYFILKSADGVIRAAFDACDVCWPAGKGYEQDGDVMVCRNCGRRFASTMVNEVAGGCNPAPLVRQVKDNQVVIRIEDILAGKKYFNFT
jgi:uncharacterized membrane protein